MNYQNNWRMFLWATRIAMYCQHDGAPSHYTRHVMQHLNDTFPNRWIGCGSRVETESDGTRGSTGGEVKGKEANGVGSQHSCTVSEHGLSSITIADAHTSAASSRLN